MENQQFIKKLIEHYGKNSQNNIQKGANRKIDIYESLYDVFNSAEDDASRKKFRRDYPNISNGTFKDLNNIILRRSIQNPPETPWLDWIEQGVKKYEGRLNKGDWQKLKPNDMIIFYDRNKEVKTKVTNLKYYKNFGEAYRDLGTQLVPGKIILPKSASVQPTLQLVSEDDVKNLYWQYFKQDDIDQFGVVAVGIDAI